MRASSMSLQFTLFAVGLWTEVTSESFLLRIHLLNDLNLENSGVFYRTKKTRARTSAHKWGLLPLLTGARASERFEASYFNTVKALNILNFVNSITFIK